MRIKDILDLELKLPSEGGITPTGTLNIDANGNYNVSNYAYASVNTPTPEGDFAIFYNGYYDCSNYANVNVNVDAIPNHTCSQPNSDTELEFVVGLEDINFIIIGETIDDGVHLIWHYIDEWESEHSGAYWTGGCTFNDIYDTSRLGEGIIEITNGQHFVTDANYHCFWW